MAEAFKSYFSKELQKFIDVLEKENINLSLFFNNLETLEINYIGDKEFNVSSRDGVYSSTNNIITINKAGKISECIYHELFHCASTRKKDKYTYIGFERSNDEFGIYIGEAINEGFTELLADKYFNTATAYDIERFYVYKLSQVLGFDIMEKFYFEGNFDEFINEFTKYVSKEEAFVFIGLSDRCFYNLHHDGRYSSDEICDYIRICANILTRAFKNKLVNKNIPLIDKQDIMLEYMEELVLAYADRDLPGPNAQFAKEVCDDLEIEYIDDEKGIDITPHRLKTKKLKKHFS